MSDQSQVLGNNEQITIVEVGTPGPIGPQGPMGDVTPEALEAADRAAESAEAAAERVSAVNALYDGTGMANVADIVTKGLTADIRAYGVVDMDITSSVINALSSKRIINVPATDFTAATVEIDGDSHFTLVIDGNVTSTSDKAGGEAENANTAAGGQKPLFKLTNCHHFKVIGVGALNPKYRESFWVENCHTFSVSVSLLGGGLNDNIHGNHIRYCTNFVICDMILDALTKKPDSGYYSYAEQLLLWDCSRFTIRNITSRNSAMNGLYIGSNCLDFMVDGCTFEYNGASGIQLAWSSFGSFPSRFTISNCKTAYNRADGIDINNTSGTVTPIYANIYGNIHTYNGWENSDPESGLPTADGSGGTYRNVSHFSVRDNVAYEPSRAGAYFYHCANFSAAGNKIIKTLAGTTGEGMYIDGCTNADIHMDSIIRPGGEAIKWYGINTNVRVQANYVEGVLSIPNVVSGTVEYNNCSLDNSNIKTSASTYLKMDAYGNSWEYTGAGTAVFAQLSHIVIEKNTIKALTAGASALNTTQNAVKLKNNRCYAENQALLVSGTVGAEVVGNYCESSSAATLQITGGASYTYLAHNRVNRLGGLDAIRVESTCLLTSKLNNIAVAGTTMFGGTYQINY